MILSWTEYSRFDDVSNFADALRCDFKITHQTTFDEFLFYWTIKLPQQTNFYYAARTIVPAYNVGWLYNEPDITKAMKDVYSSGSFRKKKQLTPVFFLGIGHNIFFLSFSITHPPDGLLKLFCSNRNVRKCNRTTRRIETGNETNNLAFGKKKTRRKPFGMSFLFNSVGNNKCLTSTVVENFLVCPRDW